MPDEMTILDGIVICSHFKKGTGNIVYSNSKKCNLHLDEENVVYTTPFDPLSWNENGNRLYETGVDHGTLYVITSNGSYGIGVAWNGLVSVTKTPSGAEATNIYADNVKYLELRSIEEFGGTIEAYTYPEEFAECDGSLGLIPGVFFGQQSRKPFGFSFRSVIGNDIKKESFGYKLHLVYGATVAPSERSYTTSNDSPEITTFSWDFTTTPIALAGYRPISCLTVDSTKIDPEKLTILENILYGVSEAPRLPLPSEVISILS